MTDINPPTFTAKRKLQKTDTTGIDFTKTATQSCITTICTYLTKAQNCQIRFVDNQYSDQFIGKGYNKGRLGILYHDSHAYFISFAGDPSTQTGGRNSVIQSFTSAFNEFYMNNYPNKSLHFYFPPTTGNYYTTYLYFIYRLMRTIGVEFINETRPIPPFNTVDEIVLERHSIRKSNKSNNSTYIIKNRSNTYEIYGKTYGASKYETSLICYAVSKLASPQDIITLYEYNEKDLKELPQSSLDVLNRMGNIKIVNIDETLERTIFYSKDPQQTLRSPRFIAHLLDRLGDKKCALCDCSLNEIVQAAHLWPVHSIKQSSLSEDKKREHATDGNNGLWLCLNHHKLFDLDIIQLQKDGTVQFNQNNITQNDMTYIASVTTVQHLPQALITPEYKFYISKRYSP